MYRILSHLTRPALALVAAMPLGLSVLLPVQAQCPSIPNIFQARLGEQTPGADISTQRLQQILASGEMPVFDVRFPLEYAISHIPGAINIPPENNTSTDQEVRVLGQYVRSGQDFVLTCNGPFCGKSKRVTTALIQAGYSESNIYRYQLGLPVWRALGNTVQTDFEGFAYIFNRDETAVFVDARGKEAFKQNTVACAVNVQPGEATAANDDGRLPLWDKGARVVVFAYDPQLAKQVASEIAKKAYWSSSYFSGTFADLENSPNIHIHSSRICRNGMK